MKINLSKWLSSLLSDEHTLEGIADRRHPTRAIRITSDVSLLVGYGEDDICLVGVLSTADGVFTKTLLACGQDPNDYDMVYNDISSDRLSFTEVYATLLEALETLDDTQLRDFASDLAQYLPAVALELTTPAVATVGAARRL